MARRFDNWQAVHDEALRRIRDGVWKPGETIPPEEELAAEFGCSRATANRALRTIAESGMIERRRKAGTRVAENPVRKARFEIPILRLEVEASGQAYSYALISSGELPPPARVQALLSLAPDTPALHVVALHLSGGQPYVLEDRWINIQTVPEARNAPFTSISANEWLVRHAPFTNGEISIQAEQASEQVAQRLGANTGDSLLGVERRTWDGSEPVTLAHLTYASRHRMRMKF